MLLAQPLIIKRVGDVVTPARKCQAVPPCARSGRAMRPHHSAAKTPYAWLWEDKNLADANLLLHVAGEPAGAAPLAALRVHRAVLAAHSEHFKTKVLGWADSDLQRAADFQPSIAVAHFIEAGSLPAGLTAHQLAQVCNEAKAREKLQCAETCSQAIVALVLEEAGKAQPVLPCLEETFDSQAECDAARLVVRCMYKEDLAESFKDALTLARMCRIAKRWVSSSIITSCLQRLIDLPPSQLPAEQLMLVLQTLPGNCALLPEHKKWQDRVHSLEGELNALPIPLHLYGEHVGWQEHARSLIVGQFGDVHAVITSAQLRTAFQQLPFAAVQQWAGSNALTVDSENSVVELISLWMAGSGGQACSKEQKQQLSCLVRVQHLSPAYALGRLPKLDWFDIPGASTARVAACCGFGMTEVLDTNKAPPAWSAAPRKQLDPDEVLRRTTIRWCVTRQQLVDLLASKDLTAEIASVPMYLAGVGWRVCVDLQRTRQDELNIALHQRRDLQGQEHASGLDGPGLSLSCCGQLVAYAECD
ncbi:BTB domain-containing protein, partial [Haematococcus lacustris]